MHVHVNTDDICILVFGGKDSTNIGMAEFSIFGLWGKTCFRCACFLEGLTPTKTLEKDDRRRFLLFNQEGFKLMQKVGKFFVCLCFVFFGGGEQNIQIGSLYRSYIYAQKVQRLIFAHLVVSGTLWSWIIPKDSLSLVGLDFQSMYTPKVLHGTSKWWFPIGISFSSGWFSGSMSNFRGVFDNYFCGFSGVPKIYQNWKGQPTTY